MGECDHLTPNHHHRLHAESRRPPAHAGHAPDAAAAPAALLLLPAHAPHDSRGDGARHAAARLHPCGRGAAGGVRGAGGGGDRQRGGDRVGGRHTVGGRRRRR